MDALWLIIGGVLGAGVAVAILGSRLRTLGIERRAESDRVVALERELVRAQSDLEHERTLSQERLATLHDAQQRLSDSFKALSAEALQASMTQLAEMARTQLQSAQNEAKGDLEKRQLAVEQLVAPLKEQLGRVDQQLVALDRDRRESRGQARGSAAHPQRDGREVAHRDGSARDRATQAECPRAVGADAAAQGRRARGHGPSL